MNPAGAPSAVLSGAAGRLERAVSYTRTCLMLVTADRLDVRTPCAQWNLAALLVHMYDSLSALTEAADLGRIGLTPVVPDEPGLPVVLALRDKACALLGGWISADHEQIDVAGTRASSDLLAAAGAIEITVHGWDVAQACGWDRPIPEDFADDLLDAVPLVVSPLDRSRRFGPRVLVRSDARSSDHLLGYLGRHPDGFW